VIPSIGSWVIVFTGQPRRAKAEIIVDETFDAVASSDEKDR